MARVQVTTPTYLKLGMIDFYDYILEFGLAVEDPRITIEAWKSEEVEMKCGEGIDSNLCNLVLEVFRQQGIMQGKNQRGYGYSIIIKTLPQTLGTQEINLLSLAVETALDLLSKKIRPIREIAARIGLFPKDIFGISIFEYGGFIETMRMKNLETGAPVFRVQFPTTFRIVIINIGTEAKSKSFKDYMTDALYNTQRYRVLEVLHEIKIFSISRDYDRLLKALSKLSEVMEERTVYLSKDFGEIVENVKKLGIARYIAPDSTGTKLVLILPPTAPSKSLCVIRNLVGQKSSNIITTTPRNNGSLIRIIED